MNQKGDSTVELISGFFILFLILLLVAFGMWGCPKYKVYQKTLNGEAQLKEAEWNRQIRVKEAEAEKEAAKALAAAEVERAKGVAEANQIIGESLQGEIGENYLRYRWIEGLHNESGERIYIPTEAGIPILEARPREIR